MRQKQRNTAFISLIAFIVIEAISISLIYSNGSIQRYRLMSKIREFQTWVWNGSANIREYFTLSKSNALLREENLRLLKEIQFQQEYISQHLSKQTYDSLLWVHNHTISYIPASVLKNTLNHNHNFIIIDKGAEDGIRDGMGVITPSGVVGYIHSVGEHHSLVSSILNKNSSYSAYLKNSGVFGTMKWEGRRSNEAILADIPIHTNFSIGDTVTTSGYSALYPRGIDVGKVSSFKVSDGTSFNITISLFQDFSKLQYVYVVDNPNSIEFQMLINKGEALK